MSTWTFAGASFYWRSDETQLQLASWQRQARLTEREILGTEETEINRTGYGPYRISGQIVIETTAHLLLLDDASGTSGTVSDGTRSCTAALTRFESEILGPGYDTGSPYTATVTFTMPEPQDYETLPRP
jgi:hypothetical protein